MGLSGRRWVFEALGVCRFYGDIVSREGLPRSSRVTVSEGR
jgi:hypothetical protein